MAVNYLYNAAPPAGEILRIGKSMEAGGALPELADIPISWLCLPLPFALDHVNVWLLGDETEGPLALVDTGIQSDGTRALWQDVFQRTRKPTELLVTHYHPDHIGLAGWVQQVCDCPCYLSQQEIDQAHKARNSTDKDFADGQTTWYRQHGLAEDSVQEVAALGNTYFPIVTELPSRVSIVAHGDQLELGGINWRVLTGGGHAPEQICLYSEALNVLISADQVLPRITPNISLVWYKTEGDPLAVFLKSLDMFKDLPEDVIVLPSHGLPFTGLHPRIASLRAHHEERLDRIIAATEEPKTASELMPVLFRRKLDPRQMMFAMGECLSHLRLLTNDGRLCEELADGISRFQRTSA